MFVLLYYMTDIAYNYWINKVADNFRNIRLPEFFDGLFNYVFPVNYRSQQRTKLMKCYQNDKKVAQYVHELEELFSMVGTFSEREKVVKLWHGLRQSIQQGLYRDGLNEEVSPWDHVVLQAKVIELSESVVVKDHGRGSANGQAPVSHRHSKGKARNVSKGRHDTRPPNRDRPDQTQHYHNRNSTPQGNHSRQKSNSNHGRPKYNDQQKTPFNQPRRQLSDKERSELLAAGKCFYCKGEGHISRNCPKKSNVSSNTSKPPGVTNFSIEINEEDQPEDDVEVMDNISLNMMEIIPDELPREAHYSGLQETWNIYIPNMPICRRLGDTLARMAEYILTFQQPYPGDMPMVSHQTAPDRFYVTRGAFQQYYVFDKTCLIRSEINIRYLLDPHFIIGEWYAAQLASHFGFPKNVMYMHDMGDSYAYNAQLVLQTGISTMYPTWSPNVGDEHRFTVEQHSETAYYESPIGESFFSSGFPPVRCQIKTEGTFFYVWLCVHVISNPQTFPRTGIFCRLSVTCVLQAVE